MDQFANYGNEFTADYYKVTNNSPFPCYMTFNKFLLSDEDRAEYEAFKERAEYIGVTPEDAASRRKLPEAFKMIPFYERLGKGVKFRVTDRVVVNDKSVSSIRYEYRFVIGGDTEILKKKGTVGFARFLCDKFEITYTREETLSQLADKLKERFGSNVRVLTNTQWNESGLKNYEERKIVFKLQPGQTTQKEVVTGFLVATPLSDIELSEVKESGEEYIPNANQIDEAPALPEVNEMPSDYKLLMDRIASMEEELKKRTEDMDVKQPGEDKTVYDTWTKAELHKALADKGIAFGSRDTNAQLIELLTKE